MLISFLFVFIVYMKTKEFFFKESNKMNTQQASHVVLLLVFGRHLVRISPRTKGFLTEVSRGFHQFLQENATVALYISANSFIHVIQIHFHYNPTIKLCMVWVTCCIIKQAADRSLLVYFPQVGSYDLNAVSVSPFIKFWIPKQPFWNVV